MAPLASPGLAAASKGAAWATIVVWASGGGGDGAAAGAVTSAPLALAYRVTGFNATGGALDPLGAGHLTVVAPNFTSTPLSPSSSATAVAARPFLQSVVLRDGSVLAAVSYATNESDVRCGLWHLAASDSPSDDAGDGGAALILEPTSTDSAVGLAVPAGATSAAAAVFGCAPDGGLPEGATDLCTALVFATTPPTPQGAAPMGESSDEGCGLWLVVSPWGGGAAEPTCLADSSSSASASRARTVAAKAVTEGATASRTALAVGPHDLSVAAVAIPAGGGTSGDGATIGATTAAVAVAFSSGGVVFGAMACVDLASGAAAVNDPAACATLTTTSAAASAASAAAATSGDPPTLLPLWVGAAPSISLALLPVSASSSSSSQASASSSSSSSLSRVAVLAASDGGYCANNEPHNKDASTGLCDQPPVASAGACVGPLASMRTPLLTPSRTLAQISLASARRCVVSCGRCALFAPL